MKTAGEGGSTSAMAGVDAGMQRHGTMADGDVHDEPMKSVLAGAVRSCLGSGRALLGSAPECGVARHNARHLRRT